MLHAMDIERSLAFYELLGFVTVDSDCGKPLGWARMHCEGGALMFVRALGLSRVALAYDLNRGVRRRGWPSEGVALCPRPQMILFCTSSG